MAKFPTMEEFAKGAAEKVLDDYEFNGKTIREWAELILSGDAVEVVRCKDCDFACPGNYGIVCTAWGARTEPNMFCGNGERREGK